MKQMQNSLCLILFAFWIGPLCTDAQSQMKIADYGSEKIGYQVVDSTTDALQKFRIKLFAKYPTGSIAYAGLGYFNAKYCLADLSCGIKGDFSVDGSFFVKTFTDKKVINMSLKAEGTGYNTYAHGSYGMAFYTVNIPIIRKIYLAPHIGFSERDALSVPSISALYDGSVSGGPPVNLQPLFPEIAIGGSLVRAIYAKVIRTEVSNNNKTKIVQYPKLLAVKLDVLVYPDTKQVLDTTNFRQNGVNPDLLKYSKVGARLSIQGQETWLNLGKNGNAGFLYLIAGEKNAVGWGYFGELGIYAAF